MPCLIHTYSRSSPSGKVSGEEVPMEDNLAYGDVNVYDTVKEPKENWLQILLSTATVIFLLLLQLCGMYSWNNNR